MLYQNSVHLENRGVLDTFFGLHTFTQNQRTVTLRTYKHFQDGLSDESDQ